MTTAFRRGAATTALLAPAIGGLAAAPATAVQAPVTVHTVTADDFKVTENSTTYNSWHQGTNTGRNGVAALPGNGGWVLNGHNQVFKGLNGSIDSKYLTSLLTNISAEVTGDAWYQVALFTAPEDSGFTTLRKVVGGDKWISSADIKDFGGTTLVNKNTDELNAVDMASKLETAAASFVAPDASSPLKILGVGLFTDKAETNVVIKSLTTEIDRYEFRAPVNAVVGEELGFGDIADDATNYNVWHEGFDGVAAPSKDAYGEDGLTLTGKTQILKGASDGLLGESIFTVAASLDADGTGDAWYQIPVRFGAESSAFTTLRQEVGTNSDQWITSRAIGSLSANTAYSLQELNLAMPQVAQASAGYLNGVEVIGYGLLVDTGKTATIKSFSALNTTYTFTFAADTVVDSGVFDPKVTQTGEPNVGEELAIEVTNLPDGFEYEVFAELVGTGVPVKGEPKVGQTLTAVPTWNVTPDLQEFQWFADDEPIEGAEGATLLLTKDLVGKKISVGVYAEKEGFESGLQFSEDTSAVVAATVVVDKDNTETGKDKDKKLPTTGTSLAGPLAAVAGLLLAGAGAFLARRRIASDN